MAMTIEELKENLDVNLFGSSRELIAGSVGVNLVGNLPLINDLITNTLLLAVTHEEKYRADLYPILSDLDRRVNHLVSYHHDEGSKYRKDLIDVIYCMTRENLSDLLERLKNGYYHWWNESMPEIKTHIVGNPQIIMTPEDWLIGFFKSYLIKKE